MPCRIVFYFALILSVFSQTAYAGPPSHVWSQSFEGIWYESAHYVSIDHLGNVAMSGSFAGDTLLIGDGYIDLGGPGGHWGEASINGFVAKYSPTGAYAWSAAEPDGFYEHIAFDQTGSVFITGRETWLQGTPFVEKRSSDGTLYQRISFEGTEFRHITCVAVDTTGNVLLSFLFRGDLDMTAAGGGIHTSRGERDILLTKLDSDLVHIWSSHYGTAEYDRVNALAVDDADRIVLSGRFSADIVFGPDTLVWSGGGTTSEDIFLVQLDTNGNHIWSQDFGTYNNDCGVAGTVVLESDAILLAGRFEDEINFGGNLLIDPYAAYLAKFNDDGSHVWSKIVNHPTDPSFTMTANKSGFGYLLGYGNDITQFGPTGDVLWQGTLGTGTYQMTCGYVDESGYLAVAGNIQGADIDFGGGVLPHYNEDDVFLALFEVNNVPALLQGHTADYRDRSIVVEWRLSSPGHDMKFFVSRAEDGGIYLPLVNPEIKQDGLTFICVDRGIEPGLRYKYRVEVSDDDGRRMLFETSEVTMPGAAFGIQSVRPNPFNPSTTIRYSIPEAGAVRLRVYDVSGRLVAMLTDEIRSAGGHTATWNGRDTIGTPAASGIYFLRLESGKLVRTKKIALLK